MLIISMLLALFGSNPVLVAPIGGAAGAGGVVMVQSNPIYQGAGLSGSNPMYRGE